jgi:hypothetical protein
VPPSLEHTSGHFLRTLSRSTKHARETLGKPYRIPPSFTTL